MIATHLQPPTSSAAQGRAGCTAFCLLAATQGRHVVSEAVLMHLQIVNYNTQRPRNKARRLCPGKGVIWQRDKKTVCAS